MITSQIPVNWDYTMADLHDIARHATHLTHGGFRHNVQERYEAAWDRIVDRLLTAEQRPSRRELLFEGVTATDRWVQTEMHHHGVSTNTYVTMGAFEAYWWRRYTPSPENDIVARLALPQIWWHLTPAQRSALAALAVLDDHRKAARALGLTGSNFGAHISGGRRRFLALWHEGEKPSRPWGKDQRAPGARTATRTLASRAGKRATNFRNRVLKPREYVLSDTCRRGHPYDKANTYVPTTGRWQRVCRTCAKSAHARRYQERKGEGERG
jgi:hypothetical protein